VKVVSLVHQHARIKEGGVPIRQPVGAVWSAFDDLGRPSEVRFFLSWDEAFGAAGITQRDVRAGD
jgi:hypothetical protein